MVEQTEALSSAAGGESAGGTPTGFTKESAGSGTSFEGIDLDQDFDSIELPVVEERPPVAPTGPQVAATTEAAPAAPVVASPQPTVAVPAPVAPVTEAAVAQQAAEPSQVIETPEDFMAAWDQGREALIERIAVEQFALSDEDLLALDQEPQVALPKLLGKVLFTAISAAQKLMIDQVPLIVANHVKATTTQRSASEAFFGQFPHLRDPKHLATVQRFADVYKREFPDMPLEQRIKEIGQLAMNHLQINASAAAPAAASAAGRVVSSQVVQSAPSHLPAAAAAGVRGGPTPVDGDPFAGALVDWGD